MGRNGGFFPPEVSGLQIDGPPIVRHTFSMQVTYNIREAQAQLSKLCRRGRKFVIANRDQPVFVALPMADFEALLETMDVLADPKAMRAVRQAGDGKSKYAALDLEDENLGL